MASEMDAVFEQHGLTGTYKTYVECIARWGRNKALFPADVQGKRVLDWECGGGVFCYLFREMGAASVRGIDSWLAEDWVAGLYGHTDMVFERKPIMEIDDSEKFDLIFANTVTEHLQNLVECFNKCRTLLAKDGILVLNHDNYYHPTGAHDHGFLRNAHGTGHIVYPGPKCWESTEKCAASQQFRDKLEAEREWMWNGADYNGDLTPENCERCAFYKRAQPWAHLIYQDEFRTLFKHEGFTTGNPSSSLNKVTPFQLRQFLVEAGFRIEQWQPSFVKNEVPEVLLKASPGLTAEDLRTWTITIRAKAV